MAKVLACDLDGTLFYPKKYKRCISKKNVKFLQDFIDAGNKLVLVSSRSIQFIATLREEIQRDFDVIACSSSQIWANKELIRDIPMDKESLKGVLEFLDKTHRPIGLFLTSDHYPCVVKQNSYVGKMLVQMYKIYISLQGKSQEPYVFDNQLFDEEFKNSKIYKVMVFYGLGINKKKISRELNKLIRENYPNIESSWSNIVNELTPLNCSKGYGLEYYCQQFAIDPKDVYVIGDSGNDISMFNRFYEHSYVMSHAYNHVKKYAKYRVSRVYKLRKYVLEGEN